MKVDLFFVLITLVARAAAAQVPIPMGVPDRPYDVTVIQNEYDQQALLAPPALTEPQLKGRRLWIQRCALCHDGVGTPTYQTLGPRLDTERIKTLGDARVRQTITQGSRRMPSFQYGLTSEQIDALLAFLKTVAPSEMAPNANRPGSTSVSENGI